MIHGVQPCTVKVIQQESDERKPRRYCYTPPSLETLLKNKQNKPKTKQHTTNVSTASVLMVHQSDFTLLEKRHKQSSTVSLWLFVILPLQAINNHQFNLDDAQFLLHSWAWSNRSYFRGDRATFSALITKRVLKQTPNISSACFLWSLSLLWLGVFAREKSAVDQEM